MLYFGAGWRRENVREGGGGAPEAQQGMGAGSHADRISVEKSYDNVVCVQMSGGGAKGRNTLRHAGGGGGGARLAGLKRS